MANPGDFDPAKAIQGLRQAEEAEAQRVKAQEDLHRANILKLFRYADKQLEEIRNPVVSEFVVTETFYTPTSRTVPGVTRSTFSGYSTEPDRSKLRPNEVVIPGSGREEVGFLSTRTLYEVATVHERQTRYYGSWLWLSNTSGADDRREGLVKLRRPRAGYARVDTRGWDPRGVGNLSKRLTDIHGREDVSVGSIGNTFEIFASLEDMAVRWSRIGHLEYHTEKVRQALDFVATGQPPEPRYIDGGYPGET